jgi:ribosomal protein S3
MMINCGMAVQRMGMVGVNVRIMKAQTVEMDSDTDW